MTNEEILRKALSMFIVMMATHPLICRIKKKTPEWIGFTTYSIFVCGIYMLALQWIANNI